MTRLKTVTPGFYAKRETLRTPTSLARLANFAVDNIHKIYAGNQQYKHCNNRENIYIQGNFHLYLIHLFY